MARLSTCKNCNKQIQKDEPKFKYSNKTYCDKCYNLKLKEKKDYDNLINAILIYFDIDKPNGRILKQIKDFKENFNYTYAGMHYCLWYLKEIKNIKFDVKYGITLVSYEYENSKRYFFKQQKIEQSINKNFKGNKTNIIKIKKRITNKEMKDKLLIDLDEI